MVDLCEKCGHRAVCRFREHYEECLQFIEDVVRCKDCKKRYTENCFMQITRYPVDMDSNPEGISVEWTEDNDFCSYGERREGNG